MSVNSKYIITKNGLMFSQKYEITFACENKNLINYLDEEITKALNNYEKKTVDKTIKKIIK